MMIKNNSYQHDRLTIKRNTKKGSISNTLPNLELVKTALDECLSNILKSRPKDPTQRMAHWVFTSNHSKKWVGTLQTDVALRDAAYAAFWKSEAECRDTNARLTKPLPAWARDLISQAAWTIHKVLGPVFSFSEFAEACTQSGGAAYEIPRSSSSVQAKYGKLSEIHCTPSALPYYKAVTSGSLMQRGREAFVAVPGSRLTTVPKNNETDRPINIEPSANMYLQKGVGNMIREKLRAARLGKDSHPYYDSNIELVKSAGVSRPSRYIDLNDQSRNQMLALLASDLDLCTIDLASASDSISTALCRLLLPSEWMAVIEDIRSPVITIDKVNWTPLEKISSMGNGFTFELESLIFYALCDAAVKQSPYPRTIIGIYGDDIVCHICAVQSVVKLLGFCGFSTNTDKSFIGGVFHESCGIYSYNHRCITPPNIRAYPTTVTDLILTINKLLRWYKRVYGWYNHHSDMIFPLLKRVPRAYRKRYIPDGCGDGAVISDAYDVRKTAIYANGIYYQRVLSFQQRKKRVDKYGALTACLKHGGYWSENSEQSHTVRITSLAVTP